MAQTFIIVGVVLACIAVVVAAHGHKHGFLGIVNAAKSVAGRVKVIIAAAVAAVIGLYDILTGGGIDLNAVLGPLAPKDWDIGRILATVSFLVLIVRFATQTRIFQSSKKTGLDDPDEPEPEK